MLREKTVNLNDEEIKVFRINNDYNGNPRYIVHFLDIGLKKYISLPKTGFKKYRGKNFGGGYVFQSYNVEDDLKYILKEVSDNF